MKVEIVDLDNFYAIGVVESVLYEEREDFLPKFWEEELGNGILEELSPFNDGSLRGLLGVCGNMNETGFDYMIGVHSTSKDSSYKCFEVFGGEFAVFECNYDINDVSLISEAYDYAFGDWIPKSGYNPDNRVAFEHYISDDVCRIYIPIIK